MRKILIALVVLSAVPALALAQQKGAAQPSQIGTCGWGNKLFEGQTGPAPQILALTTNGWFPNTFSITTGTSGCTQDGVVRSNWKTAMYIDGNTDRLARDMSIGNGESLDSLAHLIGVREEDRATFNRVMQENVSRIFRSGGTTAEITVALKEVLRSDRALAQYAASI
jgi:hypothetical protein